MEDYISYEDLISWKHKFRRETQMAQCMDHVVDFVTQSQFIDLSGLVEILIPCTSPSSFVFNKAYKVVAAPRTSSGKWPDSFGNGFFVDSSYLLTDLIDMAKTKLFMELEAHRSSQSLFDATQDLADLLKQNIDPKAINEYALIILGKLRDRDNRIVFEFSQGSTETPAMDAMYRECSSFLYHFYDMGMKLQAPVVTNLKLAVYLYFQLPSILYTIIFFMFIIDAIVIYSMLLMDVEERTYEFAMLRTLGFQNNSLVVLLLVQTFFFSVPATVIGFMLLQLFIG